MKKYVISAAFLFSYLLTFSQSQCPCCTSDHDAFDFWIGEWEVYDTLGSKVGENTILQLEDNCLITEHWRGSKGTTGRSMNYFNSADSTWNQIWVDNSGSVLQMKGSGNGSVMTLKSNSTPGQKVDYYYHQVVWTRNEDDSVTQKWTLHDQEGEEISLAFLGIYRKKK